MASDDCFLSEDQFLCSICLDVFSEPVSVPCGHNFCKACISRHWDGKQQRECPLCKERCSPELKLCINTAFREIVEDFKKHRQETSRGATQVLAQPGQVSCDCCLGNKFRATKTCLVCLASYCERHLEPHLRVEALKRHTLTDPVLNLEDKICTKHNKMLELFCRDDLTCICVLCTDHSDHDTVALDKAFVNKKGPTGKKRVAMKTKLGGKKAQRSKAGVRPRKNDDDAAAPNQAAFNPLQAPNFWWVPSQGPWERVMPMGNRDNCGFWYEIQVRHRCLKVVSESVSGHNALAHVCQSGPCLIRYVDPCRAAPGEPVHLLLLKTPEGVLVFLDYKSELVSFHDPQTDVVIYSLKGSKFIKRYFLCFIPTATRMDTPRLLGLVQSMKASLPHPDNSEFCKFIVYGFLLFIVCMSLFQA